MANVNQTRRTFLVGTGTLVATIAGCVDDDNGDTPTPEDTPTPALDEPTPTPQDDTPTPGEEDTPTPEEEDTPTPEEEDEDTPTPTMTELRSITTFDVEATADTYHDFNGSGSVVTDTFTAGHILTHFIFEHDGDSNFIVSLIDADSGDQEELVVNEIGAISGATATPVPEKDYLLEVTADGDWSIEVANLLVPLEDIQELPVEAEGTGHDVVGVVELEGNTVVTGEHDGDSNFIVRVYDEEDNDWLSGDLLFNEIGDHEGQVHTNFEGFVWVDVRAGGDWSLHFE